MAVTEEVLRKYMNLPPDNTEVALYLAAARSKAAAAGIPDYKSNAQYDLFLVALATMYYENRGLSFSSGYQATAQGAAASNARDLINSFVLELRYAGEDVTPDE